MEGTQIPYSNLFGDMGKRGFDENYISLERRTKDFYENINRNQNPNNKLYGLEIKLPDSSYTTEKKDEVVLDFKKQLGNGSLVFSRNYQEQDSIRLLVKTTKENLDKIIGEYDSEVLKPHFYETNSYQSMTLQ